MKTYKSLLKSNETLTKKAIKDFMNHLCENENLDLPQNRIKKFINDFVNSQCKHNPFIKPVIVPKNKIVHPKEPWKIEFDYRSWVLRATKTSGVPYLFKNERWPACKTCKHPMKLICQLNLGEISDDIGINFGKGIIQWFQCENMIDTNNSCIDYERNIYFSSDLEQSFIINDNRYIGHSETFNKNNFISLRHITRKPSVYWNTTIEEKYRSYFKKHAASAKNDGHVFKDFQIDHYEIMSESDVCSDNMEDNFRSLFNDHFGYEEIDLNEAYNDYIGMNFNKPMNSRITKRYKQEKILPADTTNTFSILGQNDWLNDPSIVIYPPCPKCNDDMEYLLSVSDSSLTYRLFRCLRHSKELAMAYGTTI